MANVKKNESDSKNTKYIVLPRNQDTYEEKYAVCNGRKLPFEVPVFLTRNDVDTLESQKEPFQTTDTMTVYDAMEKFSVDQAKASEIVRAQQMHPEIGGSTIKWRSKYIVQAV